MNEPANFVTGSEEGCNSNKWNNPPYKPNILGTLADKTVCPDALQTWGKHYDVHNLFGYSQTLQTLPATRNATGKRSIVISRSTFPGSGKYSGHWLGDNYSQWSNLYYSIIGCLEFNLFGIPYIGADICGFNGDTNEQLCQRWMQLGAFYTYARNHNGLNYMEQDPASLGDEVARVSREVLQIRYTLLPYLYTLFYHANVDGHTVMRPLFHEFYNDITAYDVDKQFLWGPAFLISPVLDQDAVTVDAYFPDDRWFDYYTGAEETNGRGTTITLNAPMDYIPLHVRGGYILPTQEHAVTTTISRTNPMGLIIALDNAGEADGDLYWDDGDEAALLSVRYIAILKVVFLQNTLTNTITTNNYSEADSLTWGTLRVLGLTSVSSVTINGSNHGSFSFNSSTKVRTPTTKFTNQFSETK
ncbi:Maltase-glucoamylase, intestinal [Holothuria leucospilota]|uniref:Maltase-glucoamylase, intestinal n=1 Tax=Holothuria leucospilota TaxID=206669 RepID=A0A9Q1GXQ1_HOLLE|nr:Maltase-glucoamylase, intestinal [Holothuria leucospilota]